jgi:membrane protein implicated in regulation of membrane protease activity
MSTLTLHPITARDPISAGSHDLATPLILVILVAGVIGLAAVMAMFRSATAAISVITQPTMALFRMLVGALIIIVLLIAVLVSRPADANREPTPTSPTPTVTHAPVKPPPHGG